MSPRLLWPLVLPLAGAGVLVGHGLAYRLTGAGGVGLHGYLAHAPQLLLALSLPAVLVALSGGRARPPHPLAFALLGLGGFTAMEHLERLGHGGVPWLLAEPVFVLGLVLQLPFALAAWWLARTLLAAHPARRARPPALPRFALPLSASTTTGNPAAPRLRARTRGPPALL